MPNEKGTVLKDPGGKLNIALVYPNTYWVGMSNLGLHTIYRVLNEHPGIVCERFFLDKTRSIEHSRPLQDFHIIAFTVSYELDLINVIKILISNKIPVKSAARSGRQIIVAGGPAITLNPEPLADAMDICFLGDGETIADKFHSAFFSSNTYDQFLDKLADENGIYIPSRTLPIESEGTICGFKGPEPLISTIKPINIPAHTQIVTRNTVFNDMFMLEIARGCPWQCKFCSAKAVYSPFRPIALDVLEKHFVKALKSGLKLGLVSAALNDYPKNKMLYNKIIDMGLKIAPPSLRHGRISDSLIELLKASRVKGITLAPEAGSEMLRYAIGKRISDDTILSDVYRLVSAGVRNIKLYFIIGLPDEKLHDVDAIIDLTKRIRHIFIKVSRGNRNLGSITLSVNTMVPKSHTPYERKPMLNIREAKFRIKRIAKALRSVSNTFVTYEGPKWAYFQSILARGDRYVLDLAIQMARKEPEEWTDVLNQWNKNPDYYALRERRDNEVLPWSFYMKGDTR